MGVSARILERDLTELESRGRAGVELPCIHHVYTSWPPPCPLGLAPHFSQWSRVSCS